MNDAEEFGHRLAQARREKAVRDRRDVSQRDVAKAVGTTPPTVSRWEAGLTMPNDGKLKKLALFLGVARSWLRYGNEVRAVAVGELAPNPAKERAAGRKKG